MKILVFGASGAIGIKFIQQALGKGHFVKAFVRNPDKIKLSHPALQIIKGELNDTAAIRNCVSNTDVIVSVLGPPLVRNYEGMPLAEGHQNIIAAMSASGVKRLITLATPSVKFERDQRSIATVLPGIMAKLFFPKPYKEIVEMGKIVRNSGIDWTIVRIIAPHNKPATGNIKVSFGDRKLGFGISRDDIAQFILEAAETGSYIRSMPIIGS